MCRIRVRQLGQANLRPSAIEIVRIARRLNSCFCVNDNNKINNQVNYGHVRNRFCINDNNKIDNQVNYGHVRNSNRDLVGLINHIKITIALTRNPKQTKTDKDRKL